MSIVALCALLHCAALSLVFDAPPLPSVTWLQGPWVPTMTCINHACTLTLPPTTRPDCAHGGGPKFDYRMWPRYGAGQVPAGEWWEMQADASLLASVRLEQFSPGVTTYTAPVDVPTTRYRFQSWAGLTGSAVIRATDHRGCVVEARITR